MSRALHPLAPRLWRVASRTVELADVVTLGVEPDTDAGARFRPGQFNMLSAFGVGEAAISVSSRPGDNLVGHTIRDVGPVTHALALARVGDVVGVRGPFGTDWGVGPGPGPDGSPGDDGGDVVVVAGGIGLAPLRGAIDLLAEGRRPGSTTVLVGARSPDQVLFADDLARWSRAGVQVEVTVDVPGPGWTGPVGVVTGLLDRTRFDPTGAVALVCGPEIMIRFTARALMARGVDPDRIRVSLERNMQCGLGWCGHCQLGPLLLCRDGPVVPYAGVVETLLRQRQR